jgi:membrane protein YqaA with SNARE-associated domain
MAVSTAQAVSRCWQPAVRYCAPRVRPALLLLAMLVLSATLIVAPIDYKALGDYGYLGVFLVTLLATAAIVVPVPYLALILVAGTFLNPVLVAIVAGVAAALGEMTGYFVGYTGRSLLPQSHWYQMLERGVTRFGGLIVFGAAAIPNPFFDAVGAIAGATRMPIWQFLLICFLGKTLRFFVLALLGGSLMSA